MPETITSTFDAAVDLAGLRLNNFTLRLSLNVEQSSPATISRALLRFLRTARAFCLNKYSQWQNALKHCRNRIGSRPRVTLPGKIGHSSPRALKARRHNSDFAPDRGKRRQTLSGHGPAGRAGRGNIAPVPHPVAGHRRIRHGCRCGGAVADAAEFPDSDPTSGAGTGAGAD